MLQIKFLGIGEQVDIARKRLNAVQRDTSHPINIKYINHHHQILQHDIKGIPAMMIDGHVVAEGRVPSTTELKEFVSQYISHTKKDRLMEENTIQNILVPIDDSATARTALEFALAYGKLYDAKVDILHVCTFNFDYTESEIPHSIKELKEQKLEVVRESILDLFPEKTPEIACEIGYPVDIIKEQSSKYDLIIMGSTGKHGFVDRLLGSISSGVAQHALCPVLLIPPGEHTLDTKKILYACEPGKEIDINAMNVMNRLNDKNSLKEVHFVEVSRPGIINPTDTNHNKVLEYKRNETNSISFFMDQLEGNSIVDAINEYVQKNDIDLIMMSTVYRTPLKALFHKSTTKRMVLDIKAPILILHNDEA